MKTCQNCDHPCDLNFCPQCGQPTQTGRLDLRHLLADGLSNWFSLDSKLVRTLVNLTLRPGKTCQEYVEGHRVRYLSPLRYALVVLTLVVIVHEVLDWNMVENPFMHMDPSSLSRKELVFMEFKAFVQHHLNYIIFLAIPLFAVLLRVVHWKNRFNYVEILSMATYMVTHGMVLGFLTVPLEFLEAKFYFVFRLVLIVAFYIWSMSVFFGTEGWWSKLKYALLSFCYFFIILFVLIALNLPKLAQIMQSKP